ncbi:MAG TPA: hypothetical protein VHM88_01420 [Candidatus Acidoferrales bacterium]|jgi:hypothetical protein|nr:hypothetical protein [Candidatus Acidoferrales bacterium]
MKQDMPMLGIGLIYAGLIATLVGTASLIKPISFLGISARPRGALVLGMGLIVAATGAFLPARDSRVEAIRTHLDEFAPAYQFNEVHRIQVRAPANRVYRAIKEVTADEILFFRTLTWLRRLGRPGPESILNAPERLPLLEVATRTSFLLLAEEPEREIVLGTLVLAPARAQIKAQPTPEDFKALGASGFVKATMNFRLAEVGADTCIVTTETRVYATDASARRRFAAYWRVIYPGSALIRRMWLRAVKQRAEAAGS